MSTTPDQQAEVVVHKGGAELIERLKPLWLDLHHHHQSVQPGFQYFPDDQSWEVRSGCYR